MKYAIKRVNKPGCGGGWVSSNGCEDHVGWISVTKNTTNVMLFSSEDQARLWLESCNKLLLNVKKNNPSWAKYYIERSGYKINCDSKNYKILPAPKIETDHIKILKTAHRPSEIKSMEQTACTCCGVKFDRMVFLHVKSTTNYGKETNICKYCFENMIPNMNAQTNEFNITKEVWKEAVFINKL